MLKLKEFDEKPIVRLDDRYNFIWLLLSIGLLLALNFYGPDLIASTGSIAPFSSVMAMVLSSAAAVYLSICIIALRNGLIQVAYGLYIAGLAADGLSANFSLEQYSLAWWATLLVLTIAFTVAVNYLSRQRFLRQSVQCIVFTVVVLLMLPVTVEIIEASYAAGFAG